MTDNILNPKEFILKNIEENLLTVKYINNYNSSIQPNAINETYKKNQIPFKFNEKKNTIDVDNKIKKIKTLGHEPLLSLISIKLNLENSEQKNKLFHLLSYSVVDNKFYVNFFLLQILNDIFNEHYYESLLYLKNNNDLKLILINLYKGFSFKKDNVLVNEKLSNEELFNELNIFLKTNIKEEILELQEDYYYFNVIDLNLYKNIKQDLINLSNNKISSFCNFSYMKYNIEREKDSLTPFEPFIIPFSPTINKENLKLTDIQKLTLEGLKYNINYVLGVAGSGKTFLLSHYFLNFKHWNAYTIANDLSSLPILYASYSNSTNMIFYKHLKTYEKSFNSDELLKKHPEGINITDLVLYIERNGCENLNINEETYKSIKRRLNVKRENLNINLLIEIENKLKGYSDNVLIKEKLDNLISIIKNLDNYKTMFSIEEKKTLRQLLIGIKKYIDNNNTFFKKFFSIFFKNDNFIFSTEEQKLLRKNYPYIKESLNLNNNNDYEFLVKLFTKIKTILTNKNIFNIFDVIDKKKMNNIQFNLEELNITEYEYYYYLLHFFYIKNDLIEINKYKETMSKLTKQDQVLNEEELDLLKKLFPLHISNVSDLNHYIPLEYNYYMTLIDESLLIPNYLTYSILGRTNFITVAGDVSQMSFYHLLPKNALSADSERIYGKLKDNFSMYINEQNNKINSFYDIISYKKTFKGNPNFKILLNNFRYNINIYETLFKLSEEYMAYLNNNDLRKILNSQVNSLTPFYWEFIDNIVKPIKSNLLFIENDLYRKTETYKKIFKNIKTNNNFEEFKSFKEAKKNDVLDKKISLAILTPFTGDKKDILMILKDLEINEPDLFKYNDKQLYEEICVLSIYEVQGMEFDVVIYDSFLDKNFTEYENILMNKPQILTVAISRSKDVFFLIGKKEKFYSTESEIHKNIRTAVKEKFEYIE